MKKFVVVVVVIFGCGLLCAAPRLLLTVPLESPEEEYSANVEWDDAGFIGRIRMMIYTRGETPTKSVELPQIKPLPANLNWITNDWVACESFVAERGAAFFYMNVPREKGYMIEIFAPETDGDWLVSYVTNDAVSSDSIHTLSEKHSSIFPIMLRDLPEDGVSYMSPDFPYLLSDAVDSFTAWRKQEKFREMKFLTDVSKNPGLGNLVLASLDETAEIVYFPQGTTTTREMLALTRRQPLPDSVQKVIKGIDPPRLEIEWTGDDGQFHVTGAWEDGTSTVTELIAGKFEGVSDAPYAGPGIKDLLKADPKAKGGDGEEKKAETKEKPETKESSKSKKGSTSSSSKSKSKKPSRSN